MWDIFQTEAADAEGSLMTQTAQLPHEAVSLGKPQLPPSHKVK